MPLARARAATILSNLDLGGISHHAALIEMRKFYGTTAHEVPMFISLCQMLGHGG
jgi:hypothetical protein